MGILDTLLLIVFLAGGSVLAVYLVWTLLHSASESFHFSLSGLQFKRSALIVRRADELLGKEHWRDALDCLRAGFLFSEPSEKNAIAALRDHHQNILSRCLIAGERLGTHAPNVATVEQLLLERSELLLSLTKARENYSRFRSRRETSGRQAPSWSVKDYETRIVELRRRLKANRRETHQALDTFFAALKTAPQKDVVYH